MAEVAGVVLPIITTSDEDYSILFRQALPVGEFNARLAWLLDNMRVTLKEAKGHGLSAPQVGYGMRAVVLNDTRWPELINPVLIFRKGREVRREACLSIPSLAVEVARATKIVVTAQDRHGRAIRVNAQGPIARVIQHELDHLDGILITSKR